MTRWPRTTVVAVALLALSVLAGCGSTGGTDVTTPTTHSSEGAGIVPTAPADLVARAKAEGALTIYASTTSPTVISGLPKAFQDAYPGIRVTYTGASSGDLLPRFQSEEAAGAHTADALVLTYSTFIPSGLQSGLLAPIDTSIPGMSKAYPAKYLLANNQAAAMSIVPVGILYNTSMVTGADVPTSYGDLAKPFWKDKLGSTSPIDSPNLLTQFYALYQKYGASGLGGIGANLNQAHAKYASPAAMGQAVAAGEIAAGITMVSSAGAPLVKAGAPVKLLFPDYTSGNEFVSVASAKAPHPAAAQLWEYWLYSKAGQDAFADLDIAAAPLDPGSLPAQFAPLDLDGANSHKAEMLKLLGYPS